MSDFWITRRILHVLTGSRAYGLQDQNSDTDTRGVCLPPKRYLLGLAEVRQHVSDDDNHVVWALKRFVELALQGNPAVLEVLYTDPASQLSMDAAGRALIEARSIFLSRRVGERFIGYGADQLARIQRHRRWIVAPPSNPPNPADFKASMVGGRARFPDLDAQRAFDGALKEWQRFVSWREGRNPARAELEARFGYDTKHAMHLVRLLRMGEEILAGRGVIVRRPDAEELRSIRDGAWRYEAILALAQAAQARLNASCAASPLPQEPDRDSAECLLTALHEGSLERE